MPATRSVLVLSTLLLSVTAGEAEDLVRSREAFFEEVRQNAATKGAAWLEMLNAFGEWEKVALVFGFADPGDFTACESIREFATKQNPGRSYRCNPVS